MINMDIEKLIFLVKENKALYDPGDPKYRNKNCIATVWQAISAELNMPEDVCKEKWHQLRSNFMRVKRKMRTKSLSSEEPVTWSYFDKLSFIDLSKSNALDYTQDNFELPDPEDDVQQPDSEHTNDSEESVNPTINIISSAKPQPNINSYKRKNQFKKKLTADHTALDYLRKLGKLNSPRLDENDYNRLFLLSLLPSIRLLSPEDNMDFKIQVHQILKNKLYPTNENSKQFTSTNVTQED